MNFIEIVDKIRANVPLSHNELHLLLEWLLSDEGKHQFEEELEKRWVAFDTDGEFDYDRLLGQVHTQINATQQQQTKQRRVLRYMRYVVEAAAVVVLGLGVLYVINGNKPDTIAEVQDTQVEVYNPKGLQTVVTLPDSSKVTLNADSKLSYAQQFSGKTRTVKLQGEAYFQVTKNPSRPFIVETDRATMTVLGTSFNVRSYPDDECTQATLVEGSIKVNAGKQEHILVPGRQASIDKASQEMRVQEVNVNIATAWMDGKLYIQSNTFAQIAAILERTFNVNIKVENPQLLQKKFTGKFENGENLEQILRVISYSVSFTNHYNKETNTIVIR